MVVHDGESRAVYFDNEGHVIHYEISVDGQGRQVTFRSVDPAPMPGFRLTYLEGTAQRAASAHP